MRFEPEPSYLSGPLWLTMTKGARQKLLTLADFFRLKCIEKGKL